NSRVDNDGQEEQAVAQAFLDSLGFQTEVNRQGAPDLLIGGKLQTEQFILAHMYRMLIENNSALNVGLKTGLAGTQIVFTALINDEIQLYPEYTGTGLQVLLDPSQSTLDSLGNNPETVFSYVKKRSQEKFELQWLKPIGFENSYALLMRKKQANKLGI